MKRQGKDAKYQGLDTHPKLLGIHFTRSRSRMYTFVHDLTSAIELPPRGHLTERGLRLGAPRSCMSANVNNPDARHQLFYLGLKTRGTRVWKNDFGVECRGVGIPQPGCEDLGANIFQTFPLIHN